MKKLLLVLSVILFTSCNNSCSEKKEISNDSFEEFLGNLEKSGNLYQINAASESSESIKTGLQLLMEQFGPLNEDKVKTLFQLEIESLKRLDTITLGKTSEVFSGDTTNVRGRRCGTYDLSDSTALKAFSDGSRMVMPNILPRTYFVPVEFHVVNSDKNAWTPTLSDLKEQISILNQYFLEIKIIFYISKTTTHSNKKWAKAFRTSKGNTIFDNNYRDMVNNIKWDNPSAMHVYINQNIKVLGQATLPFENPEYQTKFDHILISTHSLKNRIDPISGYQMQGKTLVHEVGHFLGLLHTFHSKSNKWDCDNLNYNGCNSPGDYVRDTPPQRYCHFHGCGKCINNMGKDCENEADCLTCNTCAFDVTPDDVNNLMGYNPDDCIDSFTPDQYARMQKYFLRNRGYLISQVENLFSI